MQAPFPLPKELASFIAYDYLAGHPVQDFRLNIHHTTVSVSTQLHALRKVKVHFTSYNFCPRKLDKGTDLFAR